MARVLKTGETTAGTAAEKAPIVKPTGRFIRSTNIHLSTDRSPKDVTSINPDDMKPILPEMPYLPPA